MFGFYKRMAAKLGHDVTSEVEGYVVVHNYPVTTSRLRLLRVARDMVRDHRVRILICDFANGLLPRRYRDELVASLAEAARLPKEEYDSFVVRRIN